MSEIPQSQPGESNFGQTDQLTAEMNLIEAYHGTEMAPVLAVNLDILKRFAGIGIPNYTKDDLDRIKGSELPEEVLEDVGGGMIAFGAEQGPYGMSSISLKPPVPAPSPEEIDHMTSLQLEQLETSQSPKYTIGDEYPESTQRMMTDILSLTDAILVRDDSTEEGGQKDGRKVYEASYMNTPIFIEEMWSTIPAKDEKGQPISYVVRKAHIYGHESGQTALHSLSINDYKKLENAGLNGEQARDAGLKHTDVDGYIANIGAINSLVTN